MNADAEHKAWSIKENGGFGIKSDLFNPGVSSSTQKKGRSVSAVPKHPVAFVPDVLFKPCYLLLCFSLHVKLKHCFNNVLDFEQPVLKFPVCCGATVPLP